MPGPSPADPNPTLVAPDHTPAGQRTPGPAPPAGRYEVGDEIARGGMGVVHSARDTVLRRWVAVKVLQDHLAGVPEAVGRFLEEARITGQLQHPAIPPVHDLGVLPDGRPFLAMKLIRGRTLADILADGRDPAVLLPAFEKVCEAVAYAHDRGVVHRDLKPANVMVGSFGEVQVMDWGLAKVLGGPAAEIDPGAGREGTGAGGVVGTLPYMPPEQARGEVERVGRPSDVFALGATLCELLTGEPAYTGPRSVARALAEVGDLSGALARLDACGADPELVGLAKRCLAKDPADRPADAGEVARAVAAHRAGVEARLRKAESERAAAEARSAEQRRKRRWQLAAAAVAFVLLSGGGLVARWAEKKAEARRGQEARNREAIDGLLSRCEAALRDDRAAAAAAALDEAGRRVAEGGGESLRDRLERCRADLAMLAGLDRIDRDYWTAGGGRLRFAEAAARWPKAFAGFGVVPGATPPEEAARRVNDSLIGERLVGVLDRWLVSSPAAELADVLHAADPDPYRDAVRRALVGRDEGRLRELAARPEAVEQPARFAVALGLIKTVPDARREAILRLAAAHRPDDLTVLMTLGLMESPADGGPGGERWFRAALAARPDTFAAWNNLGLVMHQRGEVDEMLACYRQALRIDPGDPRARTNLGSALADRGDRDGAIAAYKEAIRTDPNLFLPHYNLGISLHEKKNLDGAVAAYKEALRVDPKSAAAHNNLGSVLQEKGDLAGAAAEYREAARLDPNNVTARDNLGKLQDKKDAAADPREAVRLNPADARAHFRLANALRDEGDPDGAVAEFRESIGLDPGYAPAHSNLGNVLVARGQLDAAIAAFREAIRLDPTDALIHSNLGGALRARGDLDGAIAACREAVRLAPGDARFHTNLGGVLSARGDVDGAIAAHREAVRLDPKLAAAHANLGNALSARRDYPAAMASYREAIRLDPKYPEPHNGLGLALLFRGDVDGAMAEFREVIRLNPKDPAPHANLANAHLGRGRYAEAIASAREAIRLDPKLAPAHALLGEALRRTGDVPAARAALAEAARLDPKRWGPLLRQLPPVPVAPPPRAVGP